MNNEQQLARARAQLRAIEEYAHFCGFDIVYAAIHWCECGHAECWAKNYKGLTMITFDFEFAGLTLEVEAELYAAEADTNTPESCDIMSVVLKGTTTSVETDDLAIHRNKDTFEFVDDLIEIAAFEAATEQAEDYADECASETASEESFQYGHRDWQ